MASRRVHRTADVYKNHKQSAVHSEVRVCCWRCFILSKINNSYAASIGLWTLIWKNSPKFFLQGQSGRERFHACLHHARKITPGKTRRGNSRSFFHPSNSLHRWSRYLSSVTASFYDSTMNLSIPCVVSGGICLFAVAPFQAWMETWLLTERRGLPLKNIPLQGCSCKRQGMNR